MSNEISVEVAYALPEQQTILPVRVAADATVAQAIERSGILNKFPELDLASLKVGIYGKAVKLDNVLRDRDRVEIYRPLIADPKVARKKRAEGDETKKEEAAEAA
jgi:putative ubiquitin-RnfH superfamily antitoxin RatB of RatAB toxin-antitoxin module